jgi:hypothetical protein
MKRNYNNYLILYLIPHGLFKDKDILNLQWSSIESLIPCLVKSLYDGSIQVRLHDFEKALTGLINAENTANMNILGKTATLWYYLTEVFHQSFGARKGNFAEELIAKWFEYYNRDGCKRLKVIKVGNRSHSLTLGKVLKQYGISSRSGKQIDFVLESRAFKRVDFIELRMSEHTGGRTAQESLLDKHEELLEMLNKGLREALLRKGFREMNLVIAILFNERHELINPADKNSYNLGRLNSLINYIMQDNHIWGKVNNLTRQGYVYCDGKKIDRDSFEEKLRESLDHSVCIASNNGEFKVWFKILLGDQFFSEYMCVKFNEIKNQWFGTIADDVWLFYTLSINEAKLAREFGQTSARKIYELLNEEKTSILNEFEKLYEDGRRGGLSLMNYVNRLNGLADQCVNEVINYAKKRDIELRVLETNDVTAIHEYLRQLCLAVFAIHLAMDKIDKDKAFDKCKWSEEEET